MEQVFKKGTKIQVVRADSGNWYKVGEIYTVHSYLEHKDAYVVEEDYDKWRDTAWIDAKDVLQFVDWESAPEGATHYNDEDCIEPWLKLDNGVRYYYRTYDNTWIEYGTEWYENRFAFHFDNAIKRPVEEKKEVNTLLDNMTHIHNEYYALITEHFTPQEEQEMNEWKGGLPPVGTEFEYSFGNGYWFKATSTYVVGDSGVVALCETMESVVEQYLDNEECEFRPIKSKEQQEKEEAIAEMVKVADPMWESQIKAEAMCKRLFDAGWRKVE